MGKGGDGDSVAWGTVALETAWCWGLVHARRLFFWGAGSYDYACISAYGHRSGQGLNEFAYSIAPCCDLAFS